MALKKPESITELAARCLGHWAVVSKTVGSLTEEQIHQLIKFELVNKQRPEVLKRLHQRYSTLRAKREREQLLGGVLPW
jgi:hypothetical protein